jgi:hypothetical protein
MVTEMNEVSTLLYYLLDVVLLNKSETETFMEEFAEEMTKTKKWPTWPGHFEYSRLLAVLVARPF